jgi:hypothetical protein
MRKILVDEQNVGTVISWFRDTMQKQYKLEKLQYDRESKKWVLTLEKVYPGSGEKQSGNLNLVGDVI